MYTGENTAIETTALLGKFANFATIGHIFSGALEFFTRRGKQLLRNFGGQMLPPTPNPPLPNAPLLSTCACVPSIFPSYN